MTATTIIIITLQDLNDNPPRFLSPQSTDISEATPIGTSVYQIMAEDRDSGINSEFAFEITSPHTEFSIDDVTGIVRVNGELDFVQIE